MGKINLANRDLSDSLPECLSGGMFGQRVKMEDLNLFVERTIFVAFARICADNFVPLQFRNRYDGQKNDRHKGMLLLHKS